MPDVNQPDLYTPGASRSTAPRSRPRRVWPWALLAVLIVAASAGGGAWWFMGRAPQQAKTAPPPMQVPVVTVKASTVPVYRSFPGTTQAMRTVTIQARVTGYLAEQGAVDGADVAAGTLLYRIDAKDYHAAFAQAQAQHDVANASLR